MNSLASFLRFHREPKPGRPGSIDDHRYRFQKAFGEALGRQTIWIGRNPSICWADSNDNLNSLYVIAYLEPTKRDSTKPFLPRMAINHFAVQLTDFDKLSDRFLSAPRRWSVELTVTVPELHDFPSWVARLVDAHESGSLAGLGEPPHPCRFEGTHGPAGLLGSRYGWSLAGTSEIEKWEAGRRIETPEVSRLGLPVPAALAGSPEVRA
jgi:hypothetical protein